MAPFGEILQSYRTPLEVYSDRNLKDLQEVLLKTKAVNDTLTLP
ncbi:hypothetical protein LptCag_1777 [Leptospirillum ferriphilum]|uniref:Uncharacterized protein n=1 Tax=Leptospirillum ferriphilum TaxID=178606 RepID=A0A094W5D0_9BACT|nr:hypothetical protein LptCag_1777 [Leptospirillum ferriphilum]